jgi:RimJ/RimL family protein N-acetyltransferase
VSARFRRATLDEVLGLVQEPAVIDEACAARYPDEGTRFFALRMLERDLADGDVFGMYHILDGAGARVGHVGFHGGPDGDQAVRIAYAVAEDRRRQGFARAAVDWLIQLVRHIPGVRVVRADADVDNVGSLRILEGAGFELKRTEGHSRFYEHQVTDPAAPHH